MNRMRMQGSGVAPLPGFLDDVAVAHYERCSGRPLHNLGWYTLFAAVRIAVMMHRHLRVMVQSGRLPADHRLLTDTVATRRHPSPRGARGEIRRSRLTAGTVAPGLR